jgi:hypothetical protein
MRHVRKIGPALLVGLTAISTLFAGMPHFVCRCPNGQVKPFCLSSPSTTGCCCGSACCGLAGAGSESCCCRSSGVNAERGCCCCGDRGANDASEPSNDPGFSAQRNCCTRTLVTPEAQSLPESKATPTSSVDHLASPTFEMGVFHSLTPLTRASTIWLADRGPPPADLVTVLRRLII